MPPLPDQKYLAAMSAVIGELKQIYHYRMLLDGEDSLQRVTDEAAAFYRDTGGNDSDLERLREAVRGILAEIEQEEHESYTGLSYPNLMLEIAQNETSSLVTIDRNKVNGYVTFRFYANSGELAGKLTFDEIEDDMVGRANAVTDYLAAKENTIIFQTEVEKVWDDYEPDSAPAMQI